MRPSRRYYAPNKGGGGGGCTPEALLGGKVECEDGRDAAGRGGLDGESLRGEVRDGTKVLAPVAFAGGPGKCMV